ncbi:unnamed protein product [Vitrella brassicaformis CCMP3155]|uniref:Uncharacterized protein n=1 Tax=Vitrella brassicaformis (strain CCMP3155) TaxID=1169540 RepID=A0A0G4E8Z0_VITBC|nr:unnamed protein product [Vitrella brassicaformis CCMP3155]|eukprot:CEL91670.1 unnamed protein product [Vitrella brassicaformis CCMP3155]
MNVVHDFHRNTVAAVNELWPHLGRFVLQAPRNRGQTNPGAEGGGEEDDEVFGAAGTREEYIQQMRQPGVEGGEVELRTIAQQRRVNIHVWYSLPTALTRIDRVQHYQFYPYNPDMATTTPLPSPWTIRTIHLLFTPGPNGGPGHYQAVDAVRMEMVTQQQQQQQAFRGGQRCTANSGEAADRTGTSSAPTTGRSKPKPKPSRKRKSAAKEKTRGKGRVLRDAASPTGPFVCPPGVVVNGQRCDANGNGNKNSNPNPQATTNSAAEYRPVCMKECPPNT